MLPLLTVFPLPRTAPSPLTMSPRLSPLIATAPGPLAVLVVLSPSVMSPKPRLNAPCWALAPASWLGLISEVSLLLSVFGEMSVCGAQFGAHVGDGAKVGSQP